MNIHTLNLDGCYFELVASKTDTGKYDCTCSLTPDVQTGISRIESIPFYITLSDIERMIEYLNNHIQLLISDKEIKETAFFFYGLGFQFQALDGDVTSEIEGDFTLRIMLNVGSAPSTGTRIYCGCECVVDVASVSVFIRELHSLG